MLAQLKGQPTGQREEKSKIILERLRGFREIQEAEAIMFYVPLDEEVDTMPLLRETLAKGKSVVIPWVDRKSGSLLPVEIRDPSHDLTRGTYGVLEPKTKLVHPFNTARLSAVLVPGLAFDRRGRRLGRGRGYYDRFLKTLPGSVRGFGLAFDFQVLDLIPASDSDICVDQIVTNE